MCGPNHDSDFDSFLYKIMTSLISNLKTCV